jgi:hypothetical protein
MARASIRRLHGANAEKLPVGETADVGAGDEERMEYFRNVVAGLVADRSRPRVRARFVVGAAAREGRGMSCLPQPWQEVAAGDITSTPPVARRWGLRPTCSLVWPSPVSARAHTRWLATTALRGGRGT